MDDAEKIAAGLTKVKEADAEPLPDIARCFDCSWSGAVNECHIEREGDWENGYHNVDICPKCGGGVDYDMSDKQILEWETWHKQRAVLEKEKEDEQD